MAKAFQTYLTTEIARISKQEKLSEDKAFLFWFAITVLELSEDNAREAMSVEGANDKGIDIFWVDNDEGRVIIAQGKYSTNLNIRPTIAPVTKLESCLNWLANPEALYRDGKPDLAQAADDFIKAEKEGFGVELWFVYTGPKCKNIDKHITVYNQNPDNIDKRRAFRHYHTDLLEASWEETEGVYRRIDKATISVANGIVLPFEGSFGEAVVATVPGDEIVNLYDEYEDRLFDRNVRLFLGVRKGSVNAGIAETLADGKASQNFWAYNNDITIICDSFYVDNATVTIKNFSIVNGCQTAVSLAQGPKEKVSNAAVLVRFIAASPEIVDDVIRFTNSQNPIRTWDIASQDRTQRRLKTEFDKLKKPFIYLTRRGARPKSELKKYRDKGILRQIRIDVIGQYAAAFRGDPVLAYKQKAFIFSKHHDDVFPPDVQVEEVLFQWFCGESARAAVKDAMAMKNDEEVRILKKGGTLFVTAVLSKVLSMRNGATYLKNASEQRITSSKTKNKLLKYALYARDCYIQAVLDQCDVDKGELATHIKNPDFFAKVIERIVRQYKKEARATQYLKEVLPSINFKTDR